MRARTALYRMVEGAGFTLLRAKTHAIWGCPCPGHPHQLTTPNTPKRSGSTPKNTAQDMRKVMRQCPALAHKLERKAA